MAFLLCLEASAETVPACVRVHAKIKDDSFPTGILDVTTWFDLYLQSNEYSNYTNPSVLQNMNCS